MFHIDSATTLFDLFTPGGINPAWWACPIQQGIPAMLNLAKSGLLFVGGIAFFIGILVAVFNYLTAYGDDSKIKKGREALKWTFIGAIVVILSATIISAVAGLVIDNSLTSSVQVLDSEGNIQLQGQNPGGKLNTLGNNSSCSVPSSDTSSDSKTSETTGNTQQ